MTMTTIILAMSGILWAALTGIASWFLTRMQKDIRSVLLNQERMHVELINASEDIAFIRKELSEHNKRLSALETAIARIEEWKKQF